MSRRRWLQFSLRFLFAATIAAAVVAWCFRPGVVKPEFSLERISQEINNKSGKKCFYAQIRLTNSGPDSIWLKDDYSCGFNIDENRPPIRNDDGSYTFPGGLGAQMVFHPTPTRLLPSQSNVFAISIEEGTQTIKIGVDIADRRKQRKQTYWSQAFAIPTDLFSSPSP